MRLPTDSRRADALYWAGFALIVVAGAVHRAFWTYTLQLPFTNPDSGSYFGTAAYTTALPAFSQYRSAGTPSLINIAALIFGGPVGILVQHNLFVMGAATMLALSIKQVLGQRMLSLCALFIALFSPKGLAFEYLLTSEHDARTLFIAYAALALWLAWRPSWWLAGLTGLVVALNMLVKLDAAPLIITTIVLLAVIWWRQPWSRRRIEVAALVFIVAVVAPILAYMTEFKARNGVFAMSMFDGANQFSHVGHLTRLDGGRYPELKERLKPLLEPYAANYAAKGNYQPNWLIYGSVTPELKAEFGDRSPAREVKEFVARRDGKGTLQAENEVFRDLALEGMAAHPLAYAQLALEMSVRLWRGGYAFDYYGITPSAAALDQHRRDRMLLRNFFFEHFGRLPAQCQDPPPPRIFGFGLMLYRGPLTSCDPLPYDRPEMRPAIQAVDAAYAAVIAPLGAVHRYIPWLGLAAAVLVALLSIFVCDRRALEVAGFGALLILVVLGYTLFHGMVNVAEEQRMTANVQDLVVIAALAFGCSAACLMYTAVRKGSYH